VNAWTILLRTLAAVALFVYPVFVWLGLSTTESSPRFVALGLLLVILPAAFLRLRRSNQPHLKGLAFVPLTVVAILLLTVALDARGLILLTPVLTNCVLLFAFGVTLRPGSMPMIERFARLQQKDLGDEQRAWCRLWTWIWCAFFVFNGATAGALAAFAPMSWWAFYNGMLCYALIGGVFLLEWLLRRRRFPQLRDGKANA